MKQHKHAEVLRAIADGKEVQWKDMATGEWHDPNQNMNPMGDLHLEWRIKPEPKPDYVQTYCITKSEGHYLIGGPAFPPKGYRDANIRLTFDGETGALKAAEVLK